MNSSAKYSLLAIFFCSALVYAGPYPPRPGPSGSGSTIYNSTATAGFPYGLQASTITVGDPTSIYTTIRENGGAVQFNSPNSDYYEFDRPCRIDTENPGSVPFFNVGHQITTDSAFLYDSNTQRLSLQSISWPDGTIQVSSPSAGGGGSGVTVYPATSTIVAPKGISASTGTFSSSVTITGLLTGTTVYMSSGTYLNQLIVGPSYPSFISPDTNYLLIAPSGNAGTNSVMYLYTKASVRGFEIGVIDTTGGGRGPRFLISDSPTTPTWNFYDGFASPFTIDESSVLARGNIVYNGTAYGPAASFSSSMTVAGSIRYTGIQKKTSNYTLAVTDSIVLASTTASGLTMTLPTAATCGISFWIKKVDMSSGTITVATTSSQTIDSSTQTYRLSQPNESRQFVSDCSNWTAWP